MDFSTSQYSRGKAASKEPTFAYDGLVRLLEFTPAWTAHCLLRINGVPYFSENCGSHEGLSLNLPLIIDGNVVYSERLAVEHLSRRAVRVYGKNPREIPHEEALMLNYLDLSLAVIYSQLTQIIESGNEDLQGKSAGKASIVSRIFGKFHYQLTNAITKQDELFVYPGCNEDDLLRRLDNTYKKLDEILKSNGGYLIKHTNTSMLKTASPSASSLSSDDNTIAHSPADAVLFGHIAQALSNEIVAPAVAGLLEKYPSLMSFFYKTLNDLFLAPASNSPHSWQVALVGISQNRHFTAMKPCKLKTVILEAVAAPGIYQIYGHRPLPDALELLSYGTSTGAVVDERLYGILDEPSGICHLRLRGPLSLFYNDLRDKRGGTVVKAGDVLKDRMTSEVSFQGLVFLSTCVGLFAYHILRE